MRVENFFRERERAAEMSANRREFFGIFAVEGFDHVEVADVSGLSSGLECSARGKGRHGSGGAGCGGSFFNSERRLNAGVFIFWFLLLRTAGQPAGYALMQAGTAPSVNGWSGADRFWLGVFVFPCRALYSRGSTT